MLHPQRNLFLSCPHPKLAPAWSLSINPILLHFTQSVRLSPGRYLVFICDPFLLSVSGLESKLHVKRALYVFPSTLSLAPEQCLTVEGSLEIPPYVPGKLQCSRHASSLRAVGQACDEAALLE